jgi:glutathione synthase/RimK-type ligase-like ATP-grasp enzyme
MEIGEQFVNWCNKKSLPASGKAFQYLKVFGCKIYSQDSELAKEDWRVHDDSNVKWELIKLPENINSKLINICKELNLTWCSVDLIFSINSEYYFLELNRLGAHYWLAPFIGLDITKEIIMEISKLKVDKYE